MSSSVATPFQLYTNELLAIFANRVVFIGDVSAVCCVQINFFCWQSSLSRPGIMHNAACHMLDQQAGRVLYPQRLAYCASDCFSSSQYFLPGAMFCDSVMVKH